MSSDDPLKAWPEVKALQELLEESDEAESRGSKPVASVRKPGASLLEITLWLIGGGALLAVWGLIE